MWIWVTLNIVIINVAASLKVAPKCFSAVCKSVSKKKRKLLLDENVDNILQQINNHKFS